ncbi:hypothetical protein PIB30_061294 [Stylosanthes scabra]|uniref:Uncharacterized protein n=1 Tax=Stylosanthes scabra TaxID=79078 RepID=A0ABU6XJ21_9FABA|nr:hypothetical protein [Stylosanthes scabra]
MSQENGMLLRSDPLTIVQRTLNRVPASVFEVRRCAFGDKSYGVAESYSREGATYWWPYSLIVWALGLVRNIAPTRELETFGPSLRVMNFLYVFRVVLSTSGYLAHVKRDPALYIPATTCPLEIQALRGDVSFFFADVAEGNDDFSLAFLVGCAVFEISVTILSLTCPMSSLRRV